MNFATVKDGIKPPTCRFAKLYCQNKIDHTEGNLQCGLNISRFDRICSRKIKKFSIFSLFCLPLPPLLVISI